MRPYLEDACDQIDAAMSSGDAFMDAGHRERLRYFMDRWARELNQWDLLAAAFEEEGGAEDE